MLRTGISAQKNKSEGIICSKEELEERLRDQLYKKGGLFVGRKVKIRSNYTVKDYIWELIYKCTGNRKGLKVLQATCYREYVLNKLVKFISCENLAEENKLILKNLIQNFSAFQGIYKVDSINCKTVLAIRETISLNAVFIEKTTKKELVEVKGDNLSEKPKRELVRQELITKAQELNKLGEFYYNKGVLLEAIKFYNKIVEFYTYQSLDEVIVIDVLKKLDEIYKKDYRVEGIRKVWGTRYPSCDTGLIDLCMRKRYYYLTINYCEEVLERIKKENCLKKENRLYSYLCSKEWSVQHDLISCYTAIQDTKNLIRCHELRFNRSGITWCDRYRALKDLANVYKKKGSAVDEIKTHERILKISDLSIDYKLETYDALIKIYENSENNDELILCHKRILGIPEIDKKRKCFAWKALAIIYQKLGKIPSAISCYQDVVAHSEELPKERINAFCSLANLHSSFFHFDDIEKAMGYYRRAVKVAGINKKVSKKIRLFVLNAWVNFYHKNGLKIEDKDLTIILIKLEGIGDFPKRKECCNDILKLSDLSREGLDRLAKLYHQMEERLGEIECYERILKTSGIVKDCRLRVLGNLIILYSLTNNLVKAKEMYKERIVLGVKPEERYISLCHLAEAYTRNGRTDKAIRYYEKILESFGDVEGAEYEALNKLAEIYIRTRRPNEAAKYYHRIIESFRIDEEYKLKALKGLAVLFDRIESVDKEIECYERILNFPKTNSRDHSEAINKLIGIYNKIDDVNFMIKGYERVLNLPGISISIKQLICNELDKIKKT